MEGTKNKTIYKIRHKTKNKRIKQMRNREVEKHVYKTKYTKNGCKKDNKHAYNVKLVQTQKVIHSYHAQGVNNRYMMKDVIVNEYSEA